MAELTSDCPRCGVKHTTFSVLADVVVGQKHGWQNFYEAFCLCRACRRGIIFLLSNSQPGTAFCVGKDKEISLYAGSLNGLFGVDRYISVADRVIESPPEYLPAPISDAFIEGAKCISIECFNASAAMFRLCLDFATGDLLPKDDSQKPPAKVCRSLGLRILWLLDQGILPEAFRELSTCIKEDGNDGAHAGNLSKAEADDIQDFTFVLLERLYTEPERLRLATERRRARRQSP